MAQAIVETSAPNQVGLFRRLFPERIDNTYGGRKFAFWLFGPIVAVKITQSVLIIINGHSIATSADGIPLETYPAAAAQTIVEVLAISSLNRLTICLICGVILLRYRSAIPFMFSLLALNYLASQVILRFVPIVTTGTPPGPIMNLTIFALMIVGLVLSLWKRGQSKDAGATLAKA